jgi:hypothetical protein
MRFFFLWPLKLNTPLTKYIFTFDVWSVLILNLRATFSFGKLPQNILIAEYSFAHIWSHFSIGIYSQIFTLMSQIRIKKYVAHP